MKAQMDDQEYVFPGCHLAATVKDGQYYEWGLYVSDADRLDGRLSLRNFLVDHQIEGGEKGSNNMWLQVAAVIETKQDFNELILAAMDAFSDEGTAPTLSLEEVLALAAQKRGK